MSEPQFPIKRWGWERNRKLLRDELVIHWRDGKREVAAWIDLLVANTFAGSQWKGETELLILARLFSMD